MADRLMRAQVTIPLDSNIPEDAIVNTWYFDQDDNGLLPPPETSYDAVVAELQAFYQAIDGVIFPTTVGALATVKIYDMRDPEPRLLRFEDTFALTPNAGQAYPGEIAICMSFAADYESGVNPARRRGRVFLGPILEALGETIGSGIHITAAARTAIADAATAVATPTDVGGSSLSWAVYSPTTDQSSSVDDAFNDVQRGWIDDTFDTQRRRGVAAITRTTF